MRGVFVLAEPPVSVHHTRSTACLFSVYTATFFKAHPLATRQAAGRRVASALPRHAALRAIR